MQYNTFQWDWSQLLHIHVLHNDKEWNDSRFLFFNLTWYMYFVIVSPRET